MVHRLLVYYNIPVEKTIEELSEKGHLYNRPRPIIGPLLLAEGLATGIDYDFGEIMYSSKPGMEINHTGLFKKFSE